MRISAKLIADWTILIFFQEGKQKTQDLHLPTLQIEIEIEREIEREIKRKSSMQRKTSLKTTEVICTRKIISSQGMDDLK